MKTRFACTVAMLAAATTASATEVTNLDTVDHRVLFEVAGSREIRTVPVNETVYFNGEPNGKISLLTAEHPSSGHGPVQADGILSGVFAGERTEGIPADADDVLVIWPGGHIGIQMHRRNGWLGG